MAGSEIFVIYTADFSFHLINILVQPF